MRYSEDLQDNGNYFNNSNTILYSFEIEPCPNCGGDLIDGKCKNIESCGYGCGEDFLDSIRKKGNVQNRVEETLDIKTKILKFTYGNYSSYSVEIKNGKIVSVKFKFNNGKKEEKFEILINDYCFEKVEEQNPYAETNIVIKINVLKIGKIAKKVRLGYGEYKNRINYFNYLGLNYQNCTKFIELLLKDYHLNNHG